MSKANTEVKPMELTDENFENEVLNAGQPVLVDFWAPWCGPCRVVGPTIEALAGDFNGRAKVAKLNVDENQGVAGALRIMSIPTVVVFDGPNVVEHAVGALSREAYAEMLERAIAKHGETGTDSAPKAAAN